jgi:tetratricopeptide (TPR) repeat protein
LAVEAAAPAGTADACAAEVASHLQQAGRDDLAAARWQRAGRYARALGALPEAVAFWEKAVNAGPAAGTAWLELAETYAWSGRKADFERAWEGALARLSPADQSAAWCRRGLWFKTVACNPTASLAAYRRAGDLLAPDAPAELRARVLLGQAWNERAPATRKRRNRCWSGRCSWYPTSIPRSPPSSRPRG